MPRADWSTPRYTGLIVKLVVVAAILTAGVVYGRPAIKRYLEKKDDEGPTMHVQIEKVQKGMFLARIGERGDLEALEEVEIKSDVAGVVVELYVEDGQEVEEGDRLFRIDDEYIVQRLKASEAEYDVAQGNVEQSRINATLEMQRIHSGIEMGRKAHELAEANLVSTKAYGEQQILQLEAVVRRLETDSMDARTTEVERAALALTKARLSVTTTQTSLTLAESEANRSAQLLERKYVSNSQHEAALGQVEAAKAGHEAAIADETLSKLNQESARKSLTQLAGEIADSRASLAKLRETTAAQQKEARLQVAQRLAELQDQRASVDDQERRGEIAIATSQKYMERSLSDLTRLRQEMGWTIKTAPRAGTVTASMLEVGQAVQSGRSEWGGGGPVMKISDLSKLVARTYVNEIEIRKVQLGVRAEINVSAYRDRTYDGQVWKIAPTATMRDNIRSFEVEVLLTNASEELRPAMTADVDIIVIERDDVLQMPIAALIEKDVTAIYAQVPKALAPKLSVGARVDVSYADDERSFPARVDRVSEDERHFDEQVIHEVRIIVDDNPDDLQWGPTTPMTLAIEAGDTLTDIMSDVRKERDPYASRLVGDG
ncbi:HlyD family efflux transporter periplasmic adaptor subunit, partial [Candidatus Poribacteria bacterium]|nr:HlyD family efflux transporter periplasmic adaptor subunit [Candidatus Poribacteria bacterium]